MVAPRLPKIRKKIRKTYKAPEVEVPADEAPEYKAPDVEAPLRSNPGNDENVGRAGENPNGRGEWGSGSNGNSS